MTRSLALALLFSASLAACGGGDEGVDRIELNNFSLSPSTIDTPASGSNSLTASWSAAAGGRAVTMGYRVSAHAIASGAASQTPTEQNRFLARNCTPSAPCSAAQTLNCTFSNTGQLSCNSGASVTLGAGSYNIIARACYFNANLDEVCSTRQSTLTVR